MKKEQILKNSFIVFIVFIVICCSKLEKDRTVLYWEVNAKKYNEPIIEIDTITHGVLDLELVGNLNKYSLDSVLRSKEVSGEYMINGFMVFCSSQRTKVYSNVELQVYDIYIQNTKNLNMIRVLYTEEYGLLIKKYSDVQMCLKKEIKISNQEVVVNEFVNFCTELLSDTVFFPLPPSVPTL